jgi:hypothetical protein
LSTNFRSGTENLDRYLNYDQKVLTIVSNLTLESTYQNNPKFEFETYSINLIDSSQKNTLILTIKYKSSSYFGDDFRIERASTLQSRTYVEFINEPTLEIVRVLLKISPLSIEKNELSFLLSLSNKALCNTFNKLTCVKSYTVVSIRIYPSNNNQLFLFPIFNSPPLRPILFNWSNKDLTAVSKINAYIPSSLTQNSVITYRILNQEDNPFFIDSFNNIRLSYPISKSINTKRLNYLVKENILKF